MDFEFPVRCVLFCFYSVLLHVWILFTLHPVLVFLWLRNSRTIENACFCCCVLSAVFMFHISFSCSNPINFQHFLFFISSWQKQHIPSCRRSASSDKVGKETIVCRLFSVLIHEENMWGHDDRMGGWGGVRLRIHDSELWLNQLDDNSIAIPTNWLEFM